MEKGNLFMMISAVHRELTRANNGMLRDIGITSVQLSTLIYIGICETEGRHVCQRDIERELSMRPSSVSSMLSKLEGEGYIERKYREDNAREKVVCLTGAGETLCHENRLMADRCDGVIRGVLSAGETESLAAMLEKILRHVRGKAPGEEDNA